MERWILDVKKNLWKHHWNCATKPSETKYAMKAKKYVKKCHSNRKKGCCSYLATSYGWLLHSCRENVRNLKINSRVSITHDFYKNLSRIFRRFISFPKSRSETRSAIRDFKEQTNCKIPQALGAIDCTHIKISPVNEDKTDYFSRKQCHTINTQAVIGANLKILDLATEFPGSTHDARALRKTSVYRKAEILSHPLR